METRRPICRWCRGTIGTGPNTIFYLASTFFLSYGSAHLGLSRTLVLTALLIAAAIQVVTLPLFAIIADRTGTKNFLIAGCAVVAAGAFPVLLMFDTGTVVGVFGAYLLALPVLHGLVYGAAHDGPSRERDLDVNVAS